MVLPCMYIYKTNAGHLCSVLLPDYSLLLSGQIGGATVVVPLWWCTLLLCVSFILCVAMH